MAIPFKPADPTIDGIIAGLAGPRASGLQKIREVVHKAIPEVKETVNHKQACFQLNGTICYVKVHPAHLSLLFVRGDDVDDPKGALKPYGKDKLKFLRVRSEDDIDEETLAGLVRSAAALNRPAEPKPS